MPNGPGTVSEILWHFTGGPRWNKNLNRQDAELKPPDEAYAALSSILASRNSGSVNTRRSHMS